MTKLFLIAVGGAAGALLRYGIAGAAHRYFGYDFPWGTLAVNLIGSFLIGVIWAVSERAPLPPGWSPFLLVGVIGAFTTFSAYTLETLNLLRNGEIALGILNVIGSNALGLGIVYLGFVCGRLLFQLPPHSISP